MGSNTIDHKPIRYYQMNTIIMIVKEEIGKGGNKNNEILKTNLNERIYDNKNKRWK